MKKRKDYENIPTMGHKKTYDSIRELVIFIGRLIFRVLKKVLLTIKNIKQKSHRCKCKKKEDEKLLKNY